ncbi:PQQ-binding-like beta-propeller repeat protein [candidate division KSB1 bacterium]|nr:PQQ-binding-like beta-propeller repeat protein [candidate division KSB1 bacterium]
MFQPATENIQQWKKVLQIIGMISAVFAVLVSVLLVAFFIQFKTIDPLTSPALESLIQRFNENQQDEALKQEIRALDLLARKAYFTSRWQIRAGGYILFFSVLIFITAFKLYQHLNSQLPDATKLGKMPELFGIQLGARKTILISGSLLVVLAFVAGFLSHRELGGDTVFGKPKSVSGKNAAGVDKSQLNWPSFRGPGANGIAHFTNVPTEWNGENGQNIIWKTKVPSPGFNSPILWEDRLFMSGGVEDTLAVMCFNAVNGELLWQHDIKNIPGSPAKFPEVTPDVGSAAPTMATDGQRVYALFANGDLVSYDFDGNLVWEKNLGVPKNHYGHSSSLLTFQDLLLIQYDHGDGGHLLGLDGSTGNERYDQKREVQISWSSPILVNTGNRFEIMLSGVPFIMGHDPLTGAELWRVKLLTGEVAPGLAYADGMVYAVNEYAVAAGIKLGASPEVVWEYDEYLSEVSSPVATDKYLIMPTSYGTVACLDSKTGKQLWEHDFDEGFYSSPIVVGDLVYLMDMEGVMQIFKMTDTFKLVGTCPLGEEAMTIPVIGDGRIYIRGVEHLFAVGGM